MTKVPILFYNLSCHSILTCLDTFSKIMTFLHALSSICNILTITPDWLPLCFRTRCFWIRGHIAQNWGYFCWGSTSTRVRLSSPKIARAFSCTPRSSVTWSFESESRGSRMKHIQGRTSLGDYNYTFKSTTEALIIIVSVGLILIYYSIPQ